MYSRLALHSVWAACNLDVGSDYTDSERFTDSSEPDLKRGKNVQGLIEMPTQALRGILNLKRCVLMESERGCLWMCYSKEREVHQKQLVRANSPVISVALSSHCSPLHLGWFSANCR